ncbi:hypothetical protein EVAR_82602_1 [Eumeta japonica]|uniref:Uncharacterized protein n=1 Tax=Eumeta variegata TaxID=151549 RepID=A0A4C1X6V0_EUMVA|nr:hypothetical protein EVAR_82602_1 [Eumeta japonica]
MPNFKSTGCSFGDLVMRQSVSAASYFTRILIIYVCIDLATSHVAMLFEVYVKPETLSPLWGWRWSSPPPEVGLQPPARIAGPRCGVDAPAAVHGLTNANEVAPEWPLGAGAVVRATRRPLLYANIWLLREIYKTPATLFVVL